MKKYFIVGLAILFCCQIASAQKASDVLENGIQIKSSKSLFLKYENKKLNYSISTGRGNPQDPINPNHSVDSTIFLVNNPALSIFLLPLNPLNFSQSSENKIITDPVNEAALNALGLIFTMFDQTISQEGKSAKRIIGNGVIGDKTCENYEKINSQIDSIQFKLKDNKIKSDIVLAFKKLKALSFIDQKQNKESLDSINSDIKNITVKFKEINDQINSTEKIVSEYDCSYPDPFTAKYIFNNILKELSAINDDQQKRLTALKSAYQLVNEMQIKASSGGEGFGWCIRLDDIPVTEGKISNFTVSIKDSGNNLSDNNEIVSTTPKEILHETFKIRKFQRFVPEVSVGTAYTNFKYNTFGTTTDASGQQFIAAPTENTMRNLKFTAMINFNYYISDSQIHPFWQIGIGANTDAPTLLTGVGLRCNINGIKRIAISGGIAMTWLKELDKLKVGDKVSGTDEINKDLKYQFSWPPKPYIGIQYNF